MDYFEYQALTNRAFENQREAVKELLGRDVGEGYTPGEMLEDMIIQYGPKTSLGAHAALMGEIKALMCIIRQECQEQLESELAALREAATETIEAALWLVGNVVEANGEYDVSHVLQNDLISYRLAYLKGDIGEKQLQWLNTRIKESGTWKQAFDDSKPLPLPEA